LRAVLDGGPLPQRKTIEYGVQMAQGLAAAHDKGIVHRGLKPENVFVTKDGRVKILDFGLAKLAQKASTAAAGRDEITLTSSQTMPGTRFTFDPALEVLGVWSHDGRAIAYTYQGKVATGSPAPLFQIYRRAPLASTDLFSYDVEKDGKRFLVNRHVKPDNVMPLTIVLHATANPPN
jgi:serine/threonine protein kinase